MNTLRDRLVAAAFGAIAGIAPIALLCVAVMLGAIPADDPRDDGAERGAGVFLFFGVPILFGLMFGGLAVVSVALHRWLTGSPWHVFGAAAFLPPVVSCTSLAILAHDAKAVFSQDTGFVIGACAFLSVFLGVGVFACRWFLLRKARPA